MNHSGYSGSPGIEAVAGITAGVVTTLVSHPLDLVKTRLQVDRLNTSKPGAATRLTKSIYQSEGGVAGLYRGLGPNIIGNGASWAIYFVSYDTIKHWLRNSKGDQLQLSYYHYFLASGAAGTLTTICTNPIWVIKTRMLAKSADQIGAYSSMIDGARRIYQLDGLLGFYRGLVPSLFGVLHGALQFMVYEQLKKMRPGKSSRQHKELGNLDVLVCSGSSKILAGSITYPHQVIRSRLQTYDAERHYRGFYDAVLQLWRQEGLFGFYKGLGPNLLRVVPSSCITLLVYENAKAYFPAVTGQKRPQATTRSP